MRPRSRCRYNRGYRAAVAGRRRRPAGGPGRGGPSGVQHGTTCPVSELSLPFSSNAPSPPAPSQR
eukprot:7038930-Heterocapsa_arctica.AAC.1